MSSEWKTVRLGDVFMLQMGKTPDRQNMQFWNDGSNKWISIADINVFSDFRLFAASRYVSLFVVPEIYCRYLKWAFTYLLQRKILKSEKNRLSWFV